MDIKRLRKLVEAGDTSAIWDYWKELERLGQFRWRIGTLPDVYEVRSWILDIIRDAQRQGSSGTGVMLSYSIRDHSWHIYEDLIGAPRVISIIAEVPIMLSSDAFLVSSMSPIEEADIIATNMLFDIWLQLRNGRTSTPLGESVESWNNPTVAIWERQWFELPER
jgi:hypothetical protein